MSMSERDARGPEDMTRHQSSVLRYSNPRPVWADLWRLHEPLLESGRPLAAALCAGRAAGDGDGGEAQHQRESVRAVASGRLPPLSAEIGDAAAALSRSAARSVCAMRSPRRHGLDREEIFVGNGSDEVLAHTFQALLRHDAPLLFPDITYSFYPTYCRLYGVDYREVPLDSAMRVRVADYRQACGAIILPNPNAPTGIALRARRWRRWSRTIRTRSSSSTRPMLISAARARCRWFVPTTICW